MAPGKRKVFKVDTRRRAFAYVFDGAGSVSAMRRAPEGVLVEKEVQGREVNIRDLSGNRTLVRFGAGDEVMVTAGPDGVRFLLVSGAPIAEPVAWAGPIVMNTQDELRQAFAELRNGTFIQARALEARAFVSPNHRARPCEGGRALTARQAWIAPSPQARAASRTASV